jgi:hypothetical protein
MAVGRISGPLLKSNLVRNGIDLAFETDLLYLDVNNQKVGIKTSSPQHELDVNGTIRTTNFTVTNQADIGDITVQGNTISTDQNFLNLGTLDTVVYQNRLRIDSIDIEGNVISTNSSNANLELAPNGTGTVEVLNDMNVTGNLHATGNITADGDIIIGDQDTDTVVFNAEVASDIVPDAANTYQLGTDPTTGGKQWKDVWVQNFYASAITTDALTVNGIDLVSKHGNIYYVAENGADGNDGDHPQAPYATIQKALSVATGGDTIHIYPGEYTEAFPMTVPVGVTVKGHSIRSVNISPTTETRYNDAFIVNGESTVEDLTVKDFYSGGNYFTITEIVDADTFKVNVGTTNQAHTYVSGGTVDFSDSTAPVNVDTATYNESTGVLEITTVTPHDSYVGHSVFISNLTFNCNGDNRVFPDNGYGFRFATDFEVTTRSPYIRNITVITKGTTITADDPRGFLSGDAGKGAYVDGAYATAASREAAMLFHSVTFITPGVDALTATNGARIEWLNSFTYFANRGLHAFDSNAGLAYDGKTSIRLSGISGTFLAGDEVTFTSTDASTVVAVTVESVNNDILVVDGKDTNLLNFDTTPQSIVATTGSGATATTIENVDIRDFGAEVRMIGSANVYGNFGLVGDGEGVIVYAIGQNLAYIGNGKEVTNDPESVNQDNEVVELNGAKVRYNSFDHLGDFRVGDLFTVDQDAGTVSFVASALNIDVTSGITFTTGGDTTFISGERIDTGNIRLSGNTIESTAGDLNLDANSNTINLLQNVNITGNLDVTGNVSIGGNITIGNDPTDTIQIVAGIESDILPSQTNTYSLGTSAKTWSNLFVNESTIDGIRITQNYITTTDSNADLDLRANGTGNVVVPSNDVQIDQDLTVDGTATLANTNITGTITLVGNFTQTGDTTVTGDVDVTQDMTVGAAAQFEEILIDDNYITTTSSNADLELRANGTGKILIPNNNVTINNDLTVNGFTTTKDITSTGLITADSFTNTNILIDDNFITTTVSNSDLELRASGTGSIVIDDFSFNDATISTIADMTFVPGSGNVNINGTGSLKIPVGNTAQRPAPVTGQIRFNSEKGEFEGYNGTYWIRLDGLQDLDGDTRITAELTPGANDDTIRFYVNNNVVADINNSRLNTNRLTVDDIEIDGNVISSITTNTDLEFKANGTGLVKFENLGFIDSTIKNTVSDAVTVFENTGDGYVKFDGTQGVVLPVGNNATRPTGVQGMIRFNTDDSRVELYDGTSWVSVAGASGGISFAQAEEIAIEKVLIFG